MLNFPLSICEPCIVHQQPVRISLSTHRKISARNSSRPGRSRKDMLEARLRCRSGFGTAAVTEPSTRNCRLARWRTRLEIAGLIGPNFGMDAEPRCSARHDGRQLPAERRRDPARGRAITRRTPRPIADGSVMGLGRTLEIAAPYRALAVLANLLLAAREPDGRAHPAELAERPAARRVSAREPDTKSEERSCPARVRGTRPAWRASLRARSGGQRKL